MADMSPSQIGRKRILIVEDDRDAAGLMSVILRKKGYEVTVSEDGRAGLIMSASHRPDAILLDLNMPCMSGFEFLTLRQEFPVLGRVPVIVLTASHRDEDIERATALGAADYVTKPVEYAALLHCLEKHVPLPGDTPPVPGTLSLH